MKTAKLKPCPFCGNKKPEKPFFHKSVLYPLTAARIWIIECGVCTASICAVTEAKVIKAWNRRAAK